MANYDVLKNYLSKYKHQNLAHQEISRTIAQYKDLRPSSAPFVFNDGSQKQLVHLDGTIPVNYKGNVYNIPIEAWILDTHPFNPPIVYVRPTAAMQIRPGRYVDANGKVDLPYIKEWKHPSSDLLSLIQILTFTFGEECPVFSKSQRPPAGPAYPGSTPYPSNPGGMPMPGMPQPYPAPTSGYPGQTPYPSYPGAGGNTPYPGGSHYPPYPQTTQNSSFPVPYPTANTNPPATSYPGVPTPGQPSPPTAAGYPAPTTTNQYNSQTPYPANNTTSERPQFTRGGTVSEADIRASLLSAVEDKMRRRLKETFAQAQAEMDVLSKTQKDLTEGKQKLESIVTDLEKEKDDIDRNIQLLTEKDQEVKEAIQKMEDNEDVNVDEAVVTTTPLYRQLLEAFAEEQAIEDAVYYLGEGLRKNVIELESFLKRVRELSRRQFILRATIQKCREKAGLPPLV